MRLHHRLGELLVLGSGMNRPTRQTTDSRAYRDQNRTRRVRRTTQEFLTLYVLERWLARLAASPHAHTFILKGGLLLAVRGALPSQRLGTPLMLLNYPIETVLADLSAWPPGTRLILRKERLHPGAQLRLTDHGHAPDRAAHQHPSWRTPPPTR
jgi:hypothetical protein